jgi:hypothetical protein
VRSNSCPCPWPRFPYPSTNHGASVLTIRPSQMYNDSGSDPFRAPKWMGVIPDVPITGDDQGSTIYSALAHLGALGSFDESQFEAETYSREATGGSGSDSSSDVVREAQVDSTAARLMMEPKGGIPHRWQIVFMMALSFVLCNMDKVNMSVAVIPMAKELGWSATERGSGVVFVLLGLLVDPDSGRLGVDVDWWCQGSDGRCGAVVAGDAHCAAGCAHGAGCAVCHAGVCGSRRGAGAVIGDQCSSPGYSGGREGAGGDGRVRGTGRRQCPRTHALWAADFLLWVAVGVLSVRGARAAVVLGVAAGQARYERAGRGQAGDQGPQGPDKRAVGQIFEVGPGLGRDCGAFLLQLGLLYAPGLAAFVL